MAKVAILGYGTVGSGVLEVLRKNAQSISKRAGEEISVKYICDIRDFSQHEDAKLFVNNIDVVLNDSEVSVVVETIGGTNPAYFYVKSALESGRHVVTSNKELVATYGAELIAIAKAKNACFLFEASVGGGTPIITPMHQCLAANVISSIAGIVNGTTNFMLTKMANEGMSFDEALKLAQSLGYAETINPSADVDGIDACRKISVLSSLAFGKHIYPQNVPTAGIRNVTVNDIEMAAKKNCAVKLIAYASCDDTGMFSCGVEPMLVSNQNQLAGVNDVFNAVLVTGDMLGEVVFYGKGAGKLPTASAVVADIIDALKNGSSIHNSLFWNNAQPIDGFYENAAPASFYLRFDNADASAITSALGEVEIVKQASNQIMLFKSNVTALWIKAALHSAKLEAGIIMRVLE